MSTINQILRAGGFTNTVDKPGRYGLEIETETMTVDDYPKGFFKPLNVDQEGHQVYKTPLNLWDAKTDGSLRHFGIEYVFKEPLGYSNTKVALFDDFAAKTEGVPFLKDQASTSVHVHINFGTETPIVMANFITLWFMFENVLLDFSGPTRRTNTFARGARIAEQQIHNITQMFKLFEIGASRPMKFNQVHVKYAALNIGVLEKFGSLEARCFRGTTDPIEIFTWVSILESMVEFAKLPGLTPKGILSSWVSKGTEFMSDVFGKYSSDLKCEGHVEMIERNEVYTLDLVSSVSNWETFGLSYDIKEVKKPRKKPQNTMDFMQMYNDFVNTGQIPLTLNVSPNWDTIPMHLPEDTEGPF